MNLTDRVALFIEKTGISKNKFDEMIGTSNGYIGKQISKSSSIGGDIIEKIVYTFPDINPTWLLTGNGKMFLSEEKTIINNKRIEEIEALNEEDQKHIYTILDTLIRDAKARKVYK